MADNQLRVTLLGDASKLNATLNTASGRLKKFGRNISSVGRSLQTRLALPLALAGGASIKMAADFDKSMTKIQSLVGLTGEEVDGMRGQVREMATQFAVSSSEAAEALFFITSAGLRGAEAMDTLEASLKASAVGLGETATIADLATSAMNAYGSDSLGASDATDVLTAAVREGKLEASELAASMGAVLPVASNMGVQFHEVGAAFAAMSRTGTNAAHASTQLTAILSGLLKPTSDAEKALGEMGLSSSGLKEQIEEEGLLSTLNTLKTRFDANSDAAARVFPNIRALKGVLDLLGSGVETNRGIFDRMNETMGATQDAFDATSESAEFKLRKAMAEVRESFSQLGSQLLTGMMPIFKKVTSAIQKIFTAFFNLDESTQKLILGLGAIAVALPTIITLVGSLTTIMGVLLSPIGLVAAALAGIAFIIYKNWNEILPVVVGLYNQFVDLYNASDVLRKAVFGLKAVFVSVFTIARTQVRLLTNSFTTIWKLIKEFSEKGFKGSFGDVLSDGFDTSAEIVKEAGEDIGNAFSDSLSDAVGSTLEKKTTEQVQGALTNVATQAKAFVSGFIGNVGAGGGTGADPIGQSAENVEEGNNKLANGLAKTNEIIQTNKDSLTQSTLELSQQVAEVLQTSIEGMAVGIGEALGQAIESGASGARTLAAVLLGGIGNMAVQLGQLAIGTGAAIEAIKESLKSLFGIGAIAAGIALIALGTAVKARAAKIAQGGGQGNIPTFANGGIVSGTTLGIMGEYTGAKQNPEVIAPLNKLQGILDSRQAQQVNVGGEFKIQGQDLVVALQRADRNRGRLK